MLLVAFYISTGGEKSDKLYCNFSSLKNCTKTLWKEMIKAKAEKCQTIL